MLVSDADEIRLEVDERLNWTLARLGASHNHDLADAHIGGGLMCVPADFRTRPQGDW